MPLSFEQYTELVLEAYEKQNTADELRHNLKHPTTANLRRECFMTFNDRFEDLNSSDKDILRAFFETTSGIAPSEQRFNGVIRRFDRDKFRKLQSLIKREVDNPAKITVDLLAWLIDFTPRPWNYAERFTPEEIKNSILKPGPVDNSNNPEILPTYEEKETTEYTEEIKTIIAEPDHHRASYSGVNVIKKKDQTIIDQIRNAVANSWKKTTAILILVIGTLFLGQNQKVREIFGNSNNKCMYWAEDHYEKVNCNEKANGRKIVPLDEYQLENQKKIRDCKTIALESIENVYYYKISSDSIEYYTTYGRHPITGKNLKALSFYMYNKYIAPKLETVKMSLPDTGKNITSKGQ